MIAHGSLDPVISVDFARLAQERLTEAGLAVTYRESAVGHTIDPAVLGELPGWLSAAVDAAASLPTPTTWPEAGGGA